MTVCVKFLEGMSHTKLFCDVLNNGGRTQILCGSLAAACNCWNLAWRASFGVSSWTSGDVTAPGGGSAAVARATGSVVLVDDDMSLFSFGALYRAYQPHLFMQ